MASPYRAHSDVRDPVLDMVFQAAFDDNLPRFKALVMMLDRGRGRPKEAIEKLRVNDDWKLEGLSALHIADNRGSLEVCRYLVKELLLDVDLDLVDRGGRTPLLVATYCNGGTAEYLLDHGANPDKADNSGASLLHYAAELGPPL